LSALAADALAGLEIGRALPADDPDDDMRALAGGLALLGARLAEDGAPLDLLLVPVDAPRPAADGEIGARAPASTPRNGADAAARPAAPPTSLTAAASGELAGALTTAFAAARDGRARLRAGGCLLFVLSPAPAGPPAEDPAHAALASLTRTLALEWAPEHRVNALAGPRPADAVDLAALLAWRPSRTLTGAILDLDPA
jgi:NAD(P)-dependent dehydrogenase (short-subunit alcohol dehydrogenase family)